ncbi:DUF4283 domain protein, partial [Trifolium medium]|nr:DUF4283 domain protein [Trifolium medium]
MVEDEGIVLEEDLDQGEAGDLSLCLIGRFLSNRTIRMNAMKDTLSEVWTPGRGVAIKPIANMRYLFKFYHKIDKDRVEKGGPWNFENHMLVLNSVNPGDRFDSIPLNHMPMWVQVHQIPAGYITRKVGEQIGNAMGGLLEYDKNNNTGFWRSYMRIRV